MSQAGIFPSRLTPEQYLASEREAETKHEFHDGRLVAMAGGTGTHAELATNLAAELRIRTKGRPCRIYNSDMKVWIEHSRRFLYPDISGLCEPPVFHDAIGDVLLNPSFIVEVLSRSSEAYDRGRKLSLYMAVPSVREILLVSQEEVEVHKYTRQPDGIWRFEAFSGLDAVLPVLTIGSEFALREFYEGVELAPPSPEAS